MDYPEETKRCRVDGMVNHAHKLPASNQIEAADIIAAIGELGDRMDRRFAKNEADLAEIKSDIVTIKADIVTIKADIAVNTADIAIIKTELKEQHRDITKLQQETARIDGRVSQLPTLVQLASMIFGILGASIVLIRFGSGH